MRNITKNLLMSLILSVLLMPIFSVGAFASSTLSTTPIQTVPTTGTVTTTQAPSDNLNNFNYSPDAEVPNVTIDQATKWAERKGFEVVGFLKVVVQPIAIVVFIACAIVTMFGSFGHGGLVAKGIIGMAVAVVMYTGVLFAPEILQFFSQWLAS